MKETTTNGGALLMAMVFALARVLKVKPAEFARALKSEVEKPEYTTDFTMESVRLTLGSTRGSKKK